MFPSHDPDGATDVIIQEASKRKLPFMIVPCCIIPKAFAFWDKHDYRNWIKHLKRKSIKLGFVIDQYYLKMRGRNLVLFGRHKK